MQESRVVFDANNIPSPAHIVKASLIQLHEDLFLIVTTACLNVVVRSNSLMPLLDI
jgi:hypothetical protein